MGRAMSVPSNPISGIGSAAAFPLRSWACCCEAPSQLDPSRYRQRAQHGHRVDSGQLGLLEPGRSCYLYISSARDQKGETITN